MTQHSLIGLGDERIAFISIESERVRIEIEPTDLFLPHLAA